MTDNEFMAFIRQSIASHDRQLGELTDRMAQTNAAIRTLVEVSNQDATAIRTLARIAEAHESRLKDLEGGASNG